MAGKNANEKILIDPLFAIPEGAEDEFVFSREGTDVEFGDGTEGIDFDDSFDSAETLESDYDYDDGDGDEYQTPLATPENIQVVSQVIRRAPGGQQVVDVIIQVDDVEEATDYEVQITKV